MNGCYQLALGFEALNTRPIDLVFVDLSLKDSPLTDTINRLMEISAYCPAIVVTSLDDKGTINEIIDKGADDCIPKTELNDFILERAIHYNLSRREVMDKLKASKQTLKTLLDAVPVSIIQHDEQGTILEANGCARHTFDLKKNRADANYGADLWCRLSTEQRLPFLDSHVSLSGENAENRQTIELELTNALKSFDFNSAVVPGTSESNRLFISCFNDVTERQELETALTMSVSRNELAQRLYGMGVWEWQMRTNKVFWSSEMFTMWGVEADKFSCDFDDVKKLIHPDDFDTWFNNVESSLKTG